MHGPSKSFRVAAAAAAAVMLSSDIARADVGTFGAAKDNTLYEPGVGSLSNGGTLSNGAGDYFFAGLTGQSPSLSIRRALLGFDLSSIPADATINSATLTLRLSRSAQAGAATIALHRVLANWGECASHASGQEGAGAFAEPGDATWYHRFYDTAVWTTAGGDFAANASATTTVGSSGGVYYLWSGAGVNADVQSWIADPASNFGWFVLGDETRERTAKRFDSRNSTTASRRPQLVIDYTPIIAWANDADGDWSEPGNWTGGGAPNGIGAAAKLGAVITQPRTLTLDVPVTLGSLKLDSAVAYTIAGTNALTLDATGGNAVVSVTAGSHTILAPVTLVDDATFDVAPAGAVLTMTGAIAADGRSITKSGAGELHARPIRASVLTINAGKVKALTNPGSGVSVLRELNIAGGASPTAQLDLTDNALVIDYDAGDSPLAIVRAQLASGYNDANWDGPGIICSGPGSGITHGMAYAEADSVFTTFPATFLGESVDDTSILLRYTRYGDANLDGVVSLNDFNRLAANFGTTGGAVWSEGDFNYDGIVNLADFNRLAGNFGLSASGPDVTPADWSALANAIPEPVGLLAFSGAATAAAILRQRRRRQI